LIIYGKISYSYNVTHHVSTTKKLIGLVILTFFLSPVFAENGGNGFTLSPYIGILYGHSEEIVYKDPPEQNLYLSELLWDLKPLLYVGLGADYAPPDRSVTKGFTAALSFRAGLPTRTGILENRDWISPPNYNYLTHYSRHDTYSRIAFFLDTSAGYFWRFAGSLAFNVYGEFSFMHFSWSGKDGYYQYASQSSENPGYYNPWDSGISKNSYDGEVIRYNQNWFVLSPGVSLKWDMNRLFSMKAFFNYSPLIYCADRDDHLRRNVTYLDYLYLGHYLKSGGELVLSASANTSLSLFFSYKYITGPRGDTFQGGKLIAEDGAGAALSAPELGLAVKFRL
jgi:outer membrane protease